MALLIKGGELVCGSDRYGADIFCEGETITRIEPNLTAPPNAEVIEASGKYVFPGFIDPHVHIYLPFMGTFSKDTYETASKAALVGGTTTLIEMICPSRDMGDLIRKHALILARPWPEFLAETQQIMLKYPAMDAADAS
jgi:dihydropyrimidinase